MKVLWGRSLVPAIPILVFAARISLGQVAEPPQTVSIDANDWPMYNHDALGTRFNNAESSLTARNLGELKYKWVYLTSGDVYATPAVVDKTVYAGDTSGLFYALTSNGQLIWKYAAKAAITSSALVTNRLVIFGDQGGNIYGIDRSSGQLIWSVHPNPHPLAAIWGSPTWVGGRVVVGIASTEEDAAQAPGSTYPCCSFRGSVVALNPDTGETIWQTYFITEAENTAGGSGAPVWSTPTYDPALGLIFVTTGNNYRPPATGASDSFIALEAATGSIRWIRQTRANDDMPADYDFGDSPQVYTLVSGEKVVGAGQKSGTYWVVDAVTGALVGQRQAVPFCMGTQGLFSDSAVAAGVVVVNGEDCSFFSHQPIIPPTGKVIALSPDATHQLWSFTSHFAPVFSGVAVANGVVYFEASGIISAVYALDLKNGHVLSTTLLSGGISGPSVSRGQIYIGTGTKFASGIPSISGIVALGL
jgi:polyvinyl alcohol dehydrogenase (cytochrome)